MFLGWVFNAFFLAYVNSYVKTSWPDRYRLLFIALQMLVVSMLISFPLQGYGLFSIIFSTLHTLGAVVFIIRFFQDLEGRNSISTWFVKVSLIFFLLSIAGPFALGFIMANGLEHSNGYFFAVYYYLHFQYNGFFVFGVLGLFFKLLEERNIVISKERALRSGFIMALACVPAYLLSILWANPGWMFTLIGFIAAVLQIASFILFIQLFRENYSLIKKYFQPFSISIMVLIAGAYLLKIVLQLLSVHPQISQLAYAVRSYPIAYLHLVLLGIITLFILVWYIEKGFIKEKYSKPAIRMFIIGLTGMELLLIAGPSLHTLTEIDAIALQMGLFAFSTLLWISAGWFAIASCNHKNLQEN